MKFIFIPVHEQEPGCNSVSFESKCSVLSCRPDLPLDHVCLSANKDHCHGLSCCRTTFVVVVVNSLDEGKQYKQRGGRRQPWPAAGGSRRGNATAPSPHGKGSPRRAHAIVKTESREHSLFPKRASLGASEAQHYLDMDGKSGVGTSYSEEANGLLGSDPKIMQPTCRRSLWTNEQSELQWEIQWHWIKTREMFKSHELTVIRGTGNRKLLGKPVHPFEI